MNALRFLFIALLLAASPAQAQSATPAEISFWESVRDSRNPDELRAYLQAFPNGVFKPLAEARLATLGRKPAAAPAVPQASAAPLVAGEKRMPKVGDSWTYRLSYPRLRGQWGQATRAPQNLKVEVSSASDGQIADALSVDGATPVARSHGLGPTLLAQGASILSPYGLALGALPAKGVRLGRIAITDCPSTYACEAKGRVAGQEAVEVPAGKFMATKVIIDQEWRPTQLISGAGRMTGGRTLVVWYVPEIGRAAKYESRVVVGDIPPFDSNFDLELVSYDLK
jgi:hypothetical protein